MMAFQATTCGIWRTVSMKPIFSRKTPNSTAGMVPITISSASLPQAVTRPRRRSIPPSVRFTQSRQK
jgi:hypothetical protein